MTYVCLGPGTPSINQVKSLLGLAPENLGSILQIGDYDNAFGKVSDVLNDRSTLTVGYLYTDVRNGNTPAASPGQGLPSSYRNNLVHDQTVYGNLFHLFSNRWASESSVSFGRRIFYMRPCSLFSRPRSSSGSFPKSALWATPTKRSPLGRCCSRRSNKCDGAVCYRRSGS
jgi:hypothetical protein